MYAYDLEIKTSSADSPEKKFASLQKRFIDEGSLNWNQIKDMGGDSPRFIDRLLNAKAIFIKSKFPMVYQWSGLYSSPIPLTATNAVKINLVPSEPALKVVPTKDGKPKPKPERSLKNRSQNLSDINKQRGEESKTKILGAIEFFKEQGEPFTLRGFCRQANICGATLAYHKELKAQVTELQSALGVKVSNCSNEQRIANARQKIIDALEILKENPERATIKGLRDFHACYDSLKKHPDLLAQFNEIRETRKTLIREKKIPVTQYLDLKTDDAKQRLTEAIDRFDVNSKVIISKSIIAESARSTINSINKYPEILSRIEDIKMQQLEKNALTLRTRYKRHKKGKKTDTAQRIQEAINNYPLEASLISITKISDIVGCKRSTIREYPELVRAIDEFKLKQMQNGIGTSDLVVKQKIKKVLEEWDFKNFSYIRIAKKICVGADRVKRLIDADPELIQLSEKYKQNRDPFLRELMHSSPEERRKSVIKRLDEALEFFAANPEIGISYQEIAKRYRVSKSTLKNFPEYKQKILDLAAKQRGVWDLVQAKGGANDLQEIISLEAYASISKAIDSIEAAKEQISIRAFSNREGINRRTLTKYPDLIKRFEQIQYNLRKEGK